MDHTTHRSGASLARAPVGLIGLILLAYGITGLLFGSTSFTTDAVDGTVQGERWLGIEGNGWSNFVFAGAGAALLLGAPVHAAAKGMAAVVGLMLGAASVIALWDGDDVFGIMAANGWTALAWGAAAAVLLAVALLPRVRRSRTAAREEPSAGLSGLRDDEPRERRTGPRVGRTRSGLR